MSYGSKVITKEKTDVEDNMMKSKCGVNQLN